MYVQGTILRVPLLHRKILKRILKRRFVLFKTVFIDLNYCLHLYSSEMIEVDQDLMEVRMNTYPSDIWRMQGSDPVDPDDASTANDDDMSPLDPGQAPNEADASDEQGNEPI
jgi:hypothetical protein